MNNQDWRKARISPGVTVEEVIRNLDQSSMQIALVVSENDSLLGTITDGDIRRGLLKGLSLKDRADSIMNPNCVVVPESMVVENVLNLMKANKIHQMPIVDSDRRVTGLHIWDELQTSDKRENTFILMAGGRGRRLYPETENLPKPMLQVSGKPILEHILLRAKGEGFQNFTISLCYLPEIIRSHFRDGSPWEVRVNYVEEKDPLGTAGALGLLESRPRHPVVVSNADVITDIRYADMLDFHERQAADATMAVRLYEVQNPFGVVHTDGLIISGFEEKPVYKSYVNAGIYVINPDFLSLLKRNEICDMPDFFSRIRDNGGKCIVYPTHEPWIDVGRPDDLKKVRGN